MNVRLLEKKLKKIYVIYEIDRNKKKGLDFIPKKFREFNIETTSACNLKCRFCPYEKKQSPKLSMRNEMFSDVVEQALDMGYSRFNLTPCTGDVFMDRRIFQKFELLEANPRVDGYSFFTNLSIPNTQQILGLRKLRKLGSLTISFYGHDLDSFVALTKSTELVYKKFVSNVKTILQHLDQFSCNFSAGFRSNKHDNDPSIKDAELVKLLHEMKSKGLGVNASDGLFNNWGGYITQEDVRGLGIRIGKADDVYKMGTCVFLLEWVQVRADGSVSACSCRDVDASLKIGDVKEARLEEIISSRNPLYMALITEQEAGVFREVCGACDFYRSIYHRPSAWKRAPVEQQSLPEYLEKIDR